MREAKARAIEFGATSYSIDPHDALRQELARTNQLLEWARDMCQEVINQYNGPPNSETHKTQVILDTRFVNYHNILGEERDRLVRIARSSLDSNIQSRKQALAEALASVVIECFHAMTRSIPDLTQEQLQIARETLSVELTTATERLLLEAGPEIPKK